MEWRRSEWGLIMQWSGITSPPSVRRCCRSYTCNRDGPPPQTKRNEESEVDEESSGLPLVLISPVKGFWMAATEDPETGYFAGSINKTV